MKSNKKQQRWRVKIEMVENIWGDEYYVTAYPLPIESALIIGTYIHFTTAETLLPHLALRNGYIPARVLKRIKKALEQTDLLNKLERNGFKQ